MMRKVVPYGALLLALLLLAGGCGKKTRPVPPGTVMPAKINDLRYELDEKGVTLTWTTPDRTVSGERLPYRIEGFELFRAVVPEKDYCEGCPLPFGPPVSIAVGSESRRNSYREALLRPGHRYVYRVRSKAGWFVTSSESNTVSLLWDTPMRAPSSLAVAAGDRKLSLSWQRPMTLIDGTAVSDPLEYQIFRAQTGTPFTMLEEVVKEPVFVDKQVRNGEQYSYRVRAVRIHGGTRAAGMTSEPVVGMPRDLEPPVPPRLVTAVKAGKDVKIIWEVVAEEDLAGFRVYRRLPDQSAPVLLGEAGPGALMFLDTAPPQEAGNWYYSVTAFDRAVPPNESGFSMEAAFGSGD